MSTKTTIQRLFVLAAAALLVAKSSYAEVIYVLRTGGGASAAIQSEAQVPYATEDIDAASDTDSVDAIAETTASAQNEDDSFAFSQAQARGLVNTAHNLTTTLAKVNATLSSLMSVSDSVYGNSRAENQDIGTADIAVAIGDFEPQDYDPLEPLVFESGALQIVINGASSNTEEWMHLRVRVEPHYLYAVPNSSTGVYTVYYDDESDSTPAVQVDSGTAVDVTVSIVDSEWVDLSEDGEVNISAEITYPSNSRILPSSSGSHNYSYGAYGWFGLVQD